MTAAAGAANTSWSLATSVTWSVLSATPTSWPLTDRCHDRKHSDRDRHPVRLYKSISLVRSLQLLDHAAGNDPMGFAMSQYVDASDISSVMFINEIRNAPFPTDCKRSLLLWTGVRSIAMNVSLCLYVCPLTYLKNRKSKHHEIFYICYLWPWLGPSLTTMNTLCTSGFVDGIIFSHNGPYGARLIWWKFKVTHQEAIPGAKYDVYNCLV